MICIERDLGLSSDLVTAQAMPILPPHPLNPPLPNAALRLVEGENDPKPTLFAPLPGLKARLGEGLG